ncbi:hypothetical protein [Alkalihalobacillus pseudalcaliphilus]|uniref:hypothetical protein n=1 Tax=Alkalihalobacillus pseudalcaliphilus TaxID=79884 RepID=UPI00064D77D4|nr:hypothetical protein [Alkalihalobacillus pseudalcaliphilus]KMK75418.1 hypothetical protein AB990_08860 [Alkalihalobacillus pseudalcaliphilus]
MAIKKGAGAIGQLEASNEGGATADFTKFKSGTSLKVRVKGLHDLAQYYNYGIFKVVNSFTPEVPAERNDRGFITANPTPWDKAAQYHADKAKEAAEVGDKQAEDDEKAAARLYRGSEKYLVGFFDLETGQDIVVDLTRNQAQVVFAAIKKYAKKLDKIAFELSKTGSSTSTIVSLSPIIDMDEDLTDKEKENFAKGGQPFNDSLFDNLLYEADESEQLELLTKAGFDISLIGYEGEVNSNKPEQVF